MVSPKVRRILFPIDPSDHTKRAINWYLNRFAWDNDVIYLVHIVEPNYSKRFSESSSDDHSSAINSKMRESMLSGEQVADTIQKILAGRGMECKSLMHVGTKPGERIIQTAQEVSADVIIIGNRGVSAIRRTVLGSVSDYVLHHANIPVILVPPSAT